MTNPITSLRDWWHLRRRKAHLASLPRTLDGTIAYLIEQNDPEVLRRFAAASQRDSYQELGHFAGMGLRNGLGLWEREQPLVQWFRSHGLWHADDFSGILIRALWLKLQTPPQEISMAEERAYYTAYWARKGIGFDGVPIPGHPGETARSYYVRVDDKGRVYEDPCPDGESDTGM